MPDACLSFSPFRLDLANEQLWREGQLIPLRPKTFTILRYLAEHPKQLVTKEELLRAVWGDTLVSEDGLRDYLREIRQALCDNASAPRFVETVRGRGYRFLPATTTQLVSSSRFQVPSEQAKETGPRRGTWNFERGTSLVGRDSDLAQLQQLLEKAIDGERQLVFVTGEPGIGKTALVEAFLETVGAVPCDRPTVGQPRGSAPTRNVWAASGQCIEQHGTGEAFLPVLDAVGKLCRGPEGERVVEMLRRHAPMWLVQLPAFIAPEELETLQRKVQGASRERMLREIAEALAVLSADRPLLLMLEDLHWSDVSTLDLFAFIARRKESARLMIIGTYRPVEMLSDGHPLKGIVQELYAHGLATELPLRLLSEADIQAYLNERFDVTGNRRDDEGCHSEPQRSAGEESHDTRDSTRDSSTSGLRMTTLRADGGGSSLRSLTHTLHHRTGGNPLFLVSLVNDFISRDVFVQTDTGWELKEEASVLESTVPDSIRHLVARQSGRLSLEERSTLEAASVAGMEFSAAAVAAALATDTTIVERHCEHLAERQQFLKRLGVEEWPDGTLAARYSFLHALYQQLWHERVSPTRLQHCHLQIGQRKERAYGERAREIATELAVHFEQGREYQRAVRYLQLAGENALRRSAHQEAIRLVAKGLEVLKALPDTVEHAQQELTLQIALSRSLMALKGYSAPEVGKACGRARELSRQVGDARRLVPALVGLEAFYVIRGEVRVGRELADQLLRLAHSVQNAALLQSAHYGMGEVLYHLGKLTESRAHLDQAIALYDPHKRRPYLFHDPGVTCLSIAGLTLWSLGYSDQARQRMQESLSLAQALSHPFSLAFALQTAAEVQVFCQDGRTAQEQTEALITLSREQGFALRAATGTILKGWALAEQGYVEEAIVQMREGLAFCRTAGAELYTSKFLALLAWAYAKVGQVEEGLSVLAEALALVDKTGARMNEAELYRLKGKLTLQKFQVPGSKFKVTDPRSLMPDAQGEVEACFLKAIDIARKQQAKMWELRATVSLARLWQQQGKPVEARQRLVEIYNWFTEGFDTVDLREAKGLLEELGQ